MNLQKKQCVAIVPGGHDDVGNAGDFNPENPETLTIRKRREFVKIALETGAQIIPCYCMGSNQIFTIVGRSFMRFLSQFLPVSVVLFFGRFGLSVPYRQPLVTIVGK
jgi:hypothetical protein